MSRADNVAVLRAHLDAERSMDMEATLATLHPECELVDEPLGLRLAGRAGARQHYDLWWSTFGATPDAGRLHWVSDDLVIGESDLVGSHLGDFGRIEATGRPVRLPFVVFVRFRDGLLDGERFVYDLNTLLQQLGQPAFEPLAVWA